MARPAPPGFVGYLLKIDILAEEIIVEISFVIPGLRPGLCNTRASPPSDLHQGFARVRNTPGLRPGMTVPCYNIPQFDDRSVTNTIYWRFPYKITSFELFDFSAVLLGFPYFLFLSHPRIKANKKKLFKSVKPFLSFSETNEQQLIFVINTRRHFVYSFTIDQWDLC